LRWICVWFSLYLFDCWRSSFEDETLESNKMFNVATLLCLLQAQSNQN